MISTMHITWSILYFWYFHNNNFSWNLSINDQANNKKERMNHKFKYIINFFEKYISIENVSIKIISIKVFSYLYKSHKIIFHKSVYNHLDDHDITIYLFHDKWNMDKAQFHFIILSFLILRYYILWIMLRYYIFS